MGRLVSPYPQKALFFGISPCRQQKFRDGSVRCAFRNRPPHDFFLNTPSFASFRLRIVWPFKPGNAHPTCHVPNSFPPNKQNVAGRQRFTPGSNPTLHRDRHQRTFWLCFCPCQVGMNRKNRFIIPAGRNQVIPTGPKISDSFFGAIRHPISPGTGNIS